MRISPTCTTKIEEGKTEEVTVQYGHQECHIALFGEWGSLENVFYLSFCIEAELYCPLREQVSCRMLVPGSGYWRGEEASFSQLRVKGHQCLLELFVLVSWSQELVVTNSCYWAYEKQRDHLQQKETATLMVYKKSNPPFLPSFSDNGGHTE